MAISGAVWVAISGAVWVAAGAQEYEAYTARSDRKIRWEPEMDRFAHKFNFKPGQAIHIPFLGGHYVKNGPEDVSISLAIFFHTEETQRLKQALVINDLLRRRLAKIGMAPKPIHSPGSMDTFKAGLYPVMKGAVKLKNKLTGAANTASADEGY